MEDAAATDLAATRGTRSRSTLARRSHIDRISGDYCWDLVAFDGLAKRCLTEKWRVTRLRGLCTLSAPKLLCYRKRA